MRIRLAPLALVLTACFPFNPATGAATTASGHVHVTGDDPWDTAVVGIGLSHFMGPTPCLLRLYDKFTGGENDATYKLQIGIGLAGTLPAYVTGVEHVGAMPPEAANGSFSHFVGVQRSEHVSYASSGTVTITRFDAERFAGTFDLVSDHGEATGDFDAKNEDCLAPLTN